ncbi:hypothetical protein EV196_105309 [Mariniflexile fucanivorans]|uniref:Uncharacterized protein n=1 Tax=Mariniflexile fucanivorans TaxID=264023 RepID=A0A4R1RHV3_9FLAO|nr:hypothetical protein EV196_105309 [Mariniflexile fucanivorans]
MGLGNLTNLISNQVHYFKVLKGLRISTDIRTALIPTQRQGSIKNSNIQPQIYYLKVMPKLRSFR